MENLPISKTRSLCHGRVRLTMRKTRNDRKHYDNCMIISKPVLVSPWDLLVPEKL
jgi:hypothetical protein